MALNTIRLALSQINTRVGGFDFNYDLMVSRIEEARAQHADIIVFPELAVCGYPPEDLLFRTTFIEANRLYIEKIASHARDIVAIVGFVDFENDLYNAAAVLQDGKIMDVYRKIMLPNYGVFDEERYFKKGHEQSIYTFEGVRFGITICEDFWYSAGPCENQIANGAHLLLNISASPYHRGKIQDRERMLTTRAADYSAVVAYCNLVGGQDELVFDGSSCVINEQGKVIARAASFEQALLICDVDVDDVVRRRLLDNRHRRKHATSQNACLFRSIALNHRAQRSPHPIWNADMVRPYLEPLAEIYQALVAGTKDYVRKNNFEQVIIALSGGIDSTLVAVIAADALGPENVIGLGLPSRYSSDHSIKDARQLADNLGIRFQLVSIEPIFQSYLDTMTPFFDKRAVDATEENLQSRARGNIVMALSNKFGALVLTTGNKSEMAVGYATLYGDMAGGFAVIKDVPKTLVYQLCAYRNTMNPVIPCNIFDKPPSAELRPDQVDTDSLPPYDVLDDILQAYVELDLPAEKMIKRGHAPETVHRVMKMVDINEYKRRQSPPGIRITHRAFGKDRRLPITNAFHIKTPPTHKI